MGDEDDLSTPAEKLLGRLVKAKVSDPLLTETCITLRQNVRNGFCLHF